MSNHKKKILYVITKSVWGGAQRYVFDLAISLPKNKFKVAVAAGRPTLLGEPRSEGAGGNGILFNKLGASGVKTVKIKGLERDINIFKEFISLFWLLKILFEEKPDIVHLNSTKIGGLGAIAVLVYKFLSFRFEVLTFFTVHGWGFQEDRPWWQKFVIKFLAWVGSLFQDKIIVISKSDLRSTPLMINKQKLAFVPNGLSNLSFFPKETARQFLSEKIGQEIPANTIVIGAVAELTKNKGLSYLIEALKELDNLDVSPDFKCLIIGDGEDKNKLYRMARSLGLSNKVFLLGFLEGASLHLKGFDIFVLPSLKEGLPYVIMEAMAAGLPIVATNVGGVPDLLDGKYGFTVRPKDPAAIAQAIARLIRSPNLRSDLGSLARKRVLDNFSLDRMLERTTRLYEEFERRS